MAPLVTGLPAKDAHLNEGAEGSQDIRLRVGMVLSGGCRGVIWGGG